MRTASGSNRVFDFYGPQAEIDPTNPETRKYVWRKLKENYIDNGVDLLWFDEAEPEIHPEQFDNLILYVGRGDEAALIYPYCYAQLVYEGMKEMGRDDIITLSRAAYTGAQRFGTLVWSGDIRSTFESLTEQIKSGLNMAMCGMPWWNTDIGGFYDGDIHSDYFRELIVRWFQYGVFCPVMRLHGSRDGHDRSRNIKEPSGGDNEIWSFGEENLPVLADLIRLRYRLIPYIAKHMKAASEHGTPVMRPMFFDHPEDPVCWTTGDQYLFGDDILFAPISVRGQTERKVYLPEGSWTLTKDMTAHQGGQWVTVHAEVSEFIAFVKTGAEVLDAFR
jgi:alpha-D-xyloside xylohydrolase